MFVFKIALMFFGVVFLGFGYFIFFKGKYNLINNYKDDKKMQLYDDSYAKRVGLIEFTGGLTTLTLGVLSLFFSDVLTIIVFILCIMLIIVALIVNLSISKKQ